MIIFNYSAKESDLVFCDFETQSLIDLKKAGSKEYLNHKSTRIMSAVFLHGSNCHIWIPKSRLPTWGMVKTNYPNAPQEYKTIYHHDESLPNTIARMRKLVFVAHNAELFDAWLWECLISKDVPQFMDTMHLCRAAGYPGGLDRALQAMDLPPKSDNTAMLMLTQAKLGPQGIPIYPVGTGALWKKLTQYNIDDVIGLKALYQNVKSIPLYDKDFIPIHCKINQRGFQIDTNRLSNLRELWQKLQIATIDAVSELTDGALQNMDVRSPAKVKDYLARLGFTLPENSLNVNTVNQIIANPERYIADLAENDGQIILALLVMRQDVARSTVGKLDRILAECDRNGVIDRSLVYCGAQTTGRFSGRGIQPHNFPRGVELKDLEELTMRKEITLDDIYKSAQFNSTPKKKCKPSDVLSTLTRTTIVPRKGNKFIIYDFAQIEARGIAWIANCKRMLELFRSNQDLYCDMASSLYGRKITKEDKLERFVGKTIVLGCGYQMGATKFDIMARLLGCNLTEAGVTAFDCVNAYRKGFPEIPQVWKELDYAVKKAVKNPGNMYAAGKCRIAFSSGWLGIELPSKRVLRYRQARLVNKPSPWKAGEMIEAVDYTNAYGATRSLYGGIESENIVQGLSCDMMKGGISKTDSKYPIVLHVHDEIIFEVPEKKAAKLLDTIGVVVSSASDWTTGFPIGIEGHVASVYTKDKLKSSKSAKYLDGKRIQ